MNPAPTDARTSRTGSRHPVGAPRSDASDDSDRWVFAMQTGRSPYPFASYVASRSEEHTSELQSRQYLVCRLLLEKKLQKAPPSDLLSLSRFSHFLPGFFSPTKPVSVPPQTPSPVPPVKSSPLWKHFYGNCFYINS